MKKLFTTLACTLLACMAITAQAALPDLVVNTTGTTVYGVRALLSIEQDTSSGNRVQVRYSSGVQYVTDDALWTKYGKLLTACGQSCVTVDGSTTGLAYNIALSNGVYCSSSSSLIAWPNVGSPATLADGCAYWAKVKSLSN